MDRLILDRKLDSLQRCITRITSKQPANVQVLLADIDLQDVLVLNISRAVQICVDLATHLLANANLPPPNTMGEAFDQLASLGVIDQTLALRMKHAVGFRNIAVHAYSSIDWNIVFAISTKHLEDFRSFATAVLRSAHGSTV
jgi:uncharacterized protein YutE (UPF0331/DUF86 family)